MPSKRKILRSIREAVEEHLPCDFEPCETCTNFVLGEGNPYARVAFVGEAPGANEDKQGRPFVGAAGKLLEEALNVSAGLRRDQVFITNVLKARPPQNRDPTPEEIKHSWGWLASELSCVQPEIIVPLGRYALSVFIPDVKISEVRGCVIELPKLTVFPIYHPSAGLRNTKIKETILTDMNRLIDALGR